MRYAINFLTALLVSFFMACYVPFVSYYRNVNEFAFDAVFLFKSLVLPGFAILCFSFIVLEIIGSKLPHIQIETFGKNFRVSVLNVFVLLLILCFWIEGSLLSIGLPLVSGEPGLFLSIPRISIGIVIWCFIIIYGMFSWKKLASKALLLHLSLFILLIASITDAYITKVPKIPINARRHEVLNKLAFHPRENVIIIMADSVSTRAASNLFREHPEYFKEFTGFTLFKNNLGVGGNTTWATPAILKGALYEGGAYADFAKSAFDSPESLVQKFKAAGHGIYITSILPQYSFIMSDDYMKRLAISQGMTLHLYVTQSFPFIPYVFKEPAASYIAKSITGEKFIKIDGLGINAPLTDINIYKHYIGPKLKDKSSNRPTLHLHHLKGVHPPYDLHDEKGSLLSTKDGFPIAIKETFSLFADFLTELKQLDLYDNAIILFIADHGLPGIFDEPENGLTHHMLPFVMVKPRKAAGDPVLSDAPFSSSYIVSLLSLLNSNPEQFEKYCASLPEERYVFIPDDSLMLVKGKDPVTASVTLAKKTGFSLPATTLKMNKTYTLSFVEEFYDLAIPFLKENIKNQPALVINGQENARLGFIIDSGGGSMVNIKFNIARIDIDHQGKNASFPLVITDRLTGKEAFKTADFTTDSTGMNHIIVKNVSVDKDGKIYLYFTSAKINSLLEFRQMTVLAPDDKPGSVIRR